MRRVLLTLILGLLVIVSLGGAAACQSSSQNEADKILRQVRQDIQNEMGHLDQDLAAAAQKLSGLDLTGLQARSILKELLQNRSYTVDTCTLNRTGKILVVEPAAFHEFEGSDISHQEQVIRLFRTQKPALSQNFQAVEGFEAADMEHPVFSHDKEIIGSVSVLFKPEVLLGNIISPAVKDTSFDIWAMQLDGRILYDVDIEEIGINLFVDPMYQSYPQLIALGREISAKASGKGQYEFLDTGLKQTVKKEAIWATFAMHGTEWRLVLIQVIS